MSLPILSPFLSRGVFFPGVIARIETHADMGPELNSSLALYERLVRTEWAATFEGITKVFESYDDAFAWIELQKNQRPYGRSDGIYHDVLGVS